MRECIVVRKNPILHTPQIWLLLLNAFTQMLQNVVVELSIDSLVLGNEFLVYNSAYVEKKNDEHALE